MPVDAKKVLVARELREGQLVERLYPSVINRIIRIEKVEEERVLFWQKTEKGWSTLRSFSFAVADRDSYTFRAT